MHLAYLNEPRDGDREVNAEGIKATAEEIYEAAQMKMKMTRVHASLGAYKKTVNFLTKAIWMLKDVERLAGGWMEKQIREQKK